MDEEVSINKLKVKFNVSSNIYFNKKLIPEDVRELHTEYQLKVELISRINKCLTTTPIDISLIELSQALL